MTQGDTLDKIAELDRQRTADPIDEQIRAALQKSKKPRSIADLSNLIDRGEATVRAALARLKARGYNLSVTDTGIDLQPPARVGAVVKIHHPLSEYSGGWVKFGVCGDQHLCNQNSRIDVLNLLYDVYESEGITTVYNTGNWIDGEFSKNRHELLVFGMDRQIEYWIDNYPQRKGITTRFIAGACHEGWYQQRECIEIGRHAELLARDAGRSDLVYLGFLEASVELKAKHGSRHMVVSHPGGGGAYATSYPAQKWVEAVQGGEKPAVLLQGHHHKFNLGYPREVWCVDSGTCCDQTSWMRGRKIQAHVGGAIVELHQSDDGRITRFRPEFLPFYDRSFYEGMKRRFGIRKAAA
jgi:hypothetical protein